MTTVEPTATGDLTWLEQDSEAVQAFQRIRNDAARSYFASWPHTDDVRAALRRDGALARSRVPFAAADSWFRIERDGQVEHDVAVVADDPFSLGRVIFDPDPEGEGPPARISWISPSPDAQTLAVGLCLPGVEANTIRLIDVGTGTELTQPPTEVLADNWTPGVQWLRDSSALLFHCPEGPFLHDRAGETPRTLHLEAPWASSGPPGVLYLAPDGERLVAYEGLSTPRPTAIGHLDADRKVTWKPFVNELDCTLAGPIRDGQLFAVTDHDAPTGRVVALPLDTATPNDPTAWTELLTPSDLVLRAVFAIGGILYLTALKDTYSWLGTLDPVSGKVSEIPLPGRGTIHDAGPFPAMRLMPFGHPDQFLFMFSTFTERSGVYRHVPGAHGLETLLAPTGFATSMTVHDRSATARDGTSIPYQVITRADVPLGEGALPAMVFAYGGFNVALPNTLPDGVSTFIASGGAYVHAHIRGGGEFGLAWWRAARMETKQTSYDDLFAVTEDLIEHGISAPQRLAIMGGSNGGLLAGVAITQRPELWSAAALRVPMLDLIASCEDPYGRMVIEADFADPTDSRQVDRLRTISPLHLLSGAVAYPAVFLQAGATDHRCPPWHARKFTARLEEVNTSGRPVLLRVWEDNGHGLATDPATTREQDVEWLSFIMRELGLTPSTAPGS